MQFQYQYTPTDLAVIRDADDRVYFSPGTTITVWAVGLALCFIVLGATGSWSVLSWLGTFAAFFIAFYVYVLTRRGVANRETLVRYLTVNESGLCEKYCESEFHRHWSAFQRVYEVDSHFLFHHYSSVTAIPKRAVPVDQLDELRGIIDQYFPAAGKQQLAEYSDWFQQENDFSIHRFSWQDEDVEKIYASKMEPFDPLNSKAKPTKRISKRWIVYLVLFCGLSLFAFALEPREGVQGMLKLFFIPFALACPFLLGYIWWRHTVKKSRSATFRFPEEEISVLLTESHLVIGFPVAASRYGWEDIKSFVYNEYFVGFVPQNGMIHLISNRAFGGMENGLDFLRVADKLRFDESDDPSVEEKPKDVVESGNPFQPPSH